MVTFYKLHAYDKLWLKLKGEYTLFYGYGMKPNNSFSPIQMMSLVDPYVVESLKGIIGTRVIVDTVRGVVQGKLIDVKPDHIVVKEFEQDEPAFVRIQQIVFVMPIK